MKNSVIICVLFLVVVSCYQVDNPKKPANLITKDKMVDILVDMSIMSSAKGVNKKKLEQNGIVPDSFIYRKHKIDSTIFAESTNYYAFDVETFESIYNKVKDSLTVLREKYKAIEAEQKKEKKKLDSAKRAQNKKEKQLRFEKEQKKLKTKSLKQK